MTGHRRAHGRSERSRRGKTQQGAALCSGLIGLYDHVVAYRKERVLVTTWERAFGSSLSLKDWMPGTGAAGAVGVNDQVNHHFVRVFGHALLLSVLSAGVQLSQVPSFGQGFTGPTVGNVLDAAVGQELGQTSSELIRRRMNIVPIIEIRPGYAFNVTVTQDLVPRSRRRHGAPMRVKPVQSYRAMALKGRIPGELHAAPTDYTTYYRDKTGQTIDVWSLMVQMLERFVETDREFLAWRRRSRNGPGAGPTTS